MGLPSRSPLSSSRYSLLQASGSGRSERPRRTRKKCAGRKSRSTVSTPTMILLCPQLEATTARLARRWCRMTLAIEGGVPHRHNVSHLPISLAAGDRPVWPSPTRAATLADITIKARPQKERNLTRNSRRTNHWSMDPTAVAQCLVTLRPLERLGLGQWPLEDETIETSTAAPRTRPRPIQDLPDPKAQMISHTKLLVANHTTRMVHTIAKHNLNMDHTATARTAAVASRLSETCRRDATRRSKSRRFSHNKATLASPRISRALQFSVRECAGVWFFAAHICRVDELCGPSRPRRLRHIS